MTPGGLVWGGRLALVLSAVACAPVRYDDTKRIDYFRTNQTPALYLRSDPYDRLHVEIDAVQGAEPTAAAMTHLEALLQTYCDKPSGITIRRDEVIPEAESKGLPETRLAALHMSGPPADKQAEGAAYLYVLFYDSRHEQGPVDNPHVAPHYPCAIYVDMAYWGMLSQLWGVQASEAMLRDGYLAKALHHELGHCLGLVTNTTRADDLHCPRPDCVMAAVSRGPPPKQFCADCEADLVHTRQHAAGSNLRFYGPCLVRRESKYFVVYLPRYVAVRTTDLDAAAIQEYLRDARRNGLSETRVRVNLQNDGLTRAELRSVMRQLREDPDPLVRLVPDAVWWVRWVGF